MKWATPDRELLSQLSEIPEVALSGFSVRQGLAGVGVTVLKGRNYFGSWRVANDTLVWAYASLSQPHFVAHSVEEAVRHTMLLILRNLEMVAQKPAKEARAS